jgi:hypothetical protein
MVGNDDVAKDAGVGDGVGVKSFFSWSIGLSEGFLLW